MLQLYVVKSNDKIDLNNANTWSDVLVYSNGELRRSCSMIPFVVDDIIEMFTRFSNTVAYKYTVTEEQIHSPTWEQDRLQLTPDENEF